MPAAPARNRNASIGDRDAELVGSAGNRHNRSVDREETLADPSGPVGPAETGGP
jgi:hypothetical protein